jgi:hypothetical protein
VATKEENKRNAFEFSLHLKKGENYESHKTYTFKEHTAALFGVCG